MAWVQRAATRHLFRSLKSCYSRASRRPLDQQVAHYYYKPTKKGPSGQAWLALAGVTTTITGVGIYLLGQPEESIEGLDTGPEKYANENVVKAYLFRAWDHIKEYQQTFAHPSHPQLLPDTLPPPYQKPYTLIVEMNDILLHTDYDRKQGWKYQKRPGVDYFLTQLFDFYEIVVFTSEIPLTAHPLLTALDPNQLIMYNLYRDSTNYMNNHHVKDLTHLNRPLSKVIIIDTDSQSVQLQPENSIILDKWKGDITDRTLWEIVPFLQTIALHEVSDVRPVLDTYKAQGSGNVLENFKLNQAKLQQQEEQEREERKRLTQKSSSPLGGQISTFSLGSGLSRGGTHPPAAPFTTPPATPPTTAQSEPSPETKDKQSEDGDSWSLAGWVASWLGWK